jgi:indole-3-glycerol phosphate synthase
MPTPPNIPADIPDALRDIVDHKRAELDALHDSTTPEDLRAIAADTPEPRPFIAALTERPSHPAFAVIAEIKRRSPSAGLIRPEYDRPDFDPAPIARGYAMAGASAISCLTDEKYFAGHPSFIARIKPETTLPVLRKDFIIHPDQVTQSRALGADAVLLIAECLDDRALAECLERAAEHRLDVLLEIHDRSNLPRALAAIAAAPANTILGINNRDLRAMTTNLDHTTDLLEHLPDPSKVVTESGIRTGDDLARLYSAGLRIALIGEHLMRTPNPGAALQTLLNDTQSRLSM